MPLTASGGVEELNLEDLARMGGNPLLALHGVLL
jgi:hypothetical protein